MNYQQKENQILFKYIKDKFNALFDCYGYDEITLPLFEAYEKFKRYRAVDENTLLKLIDRAGNILVLRPDATFHVLKTVETFEEKIERCYYITNIFRFRDNDFEKNDTLQAGCELFGSPAPYADIEVINLAIESLRVLDIENIHIDIGHSKFVHTFLKEIGIREFREISHYHGLVDNKNLIALEEELSARGTSKKNIRQLCDIAMLFGEYDATMAKAYDVCINAKMEENLQQIQAIYDGSHPYVRLDLGFSNPMNYYTGMIFKGYVSGYGENIISGGRYDTLARQFADLPYACGFGHNIDAILDILLKRQAAPAYKPAVCVSGEDYYAAAVLCNELHKRNIRSILSEPRTGMPALIVCDKAVKVIDENGEYNTTVEKILSGEGGILC
jgi:ATP phosphoribosyltransferase regulatory subunit